VGAAKRKPRNAPSHALLLVPVRPGHAVIALPVPLTEADLSPRQKQILQRIKAADSIKEIAAMLDLSPATISQYLAALYTKVGVHSRGELALWGWEDEQGQHELPGHEPVKPGGGG